MSNFDPVDCLEQLRICTLLIDRKPNPQLAKAMAHHFNKLDYWLSNGGMNPWSCTDDFWDGFNDEQHP